MPCRWHIQKAPSRCHDGKESSQLERTVGWGRPNVDYLPNRMYYNYGNKNDMTLLESSTRKSLTFTYCGRSAQRHTCIYTISKRTKSCRIEWGNRKVFRYSLISTAFWFLMIRPVMWLILMLRDSTSQWFLKTRNNSCRRKQPLIRLIASLPEVFIFSLYVRKVVKKEAEPALHSVNREEEFIDGVTCAPNVRRSGQESLPPERFYAMLTVQSFRGK